MNQKNRKPKRFHALIVTLWMVSGSYCLFVRGVLTARYHKQRNILKVHLSISNGIDFIFRFLTDNFFPPIIFAIRTTESLGPEYSEMLILDLDVTWSESEPRTPLVCILSIGSDPTSQIATLAKNKNIRSYCFHKLNCF